jgi:hypothetical protein
MEELFFDYLFKDFIRQVLEQGFERDGIQGLDHFQGPEGKRFISR